MDDVVCRVSIPFKREGTCELHSHEPRSATKDKIVSIPFKREGTCEHPRCVGYGISGHSVSIPFKREGTCERLNVFPIFSNGAFQFPSNGKARVNLEKNCFRAAKTVSIPFKREGTCEQPLFCTQSGRGSVHPKTKRELREAFFAQKFGAKIP